MKNYVQDGHQLTLAAPYAVSSGDGALVGSIFGIAMADAANGAEVVLQTTGVVTHAKTSAQAWTVGALIYWDNSNKVMTTAAASGANKLVGVAVAAAANPSATGTVRLNGAFST
jgi:predicted RecA/RadA family phage recombinase